MPVAVGTRVGPYEITAKLGEGGPAVARGASLCELWRGLAVAQQRIRC